MNRKILALIMAALMAFAIAPVAFADIADVTVSVDAPTVGADEIFMAATITNTTDNAVTLKNIDSAKGFLKKITISGSTETAAQSSSDILLTASNKLDPGTYVDLLTFEFDGDIKRTATVSFIIPEAPAAQPQDPSTRGAAFRLSSYDANGLIVPTAAGKHGNKVLVRLPLLCVDGPVNDIKVTPRLSTSLDSFPFEIEQVDYSSYYPNTISTNQLIEFQFDMRFAHKVTAGIKRVDFDITYNYGWGSATGDSIGSCEVSLYVNVTRGYVEEGVDVGGETTSPLPKLIVDSYSFSTEKIYAGDEFALDVTVRNTSAEEDMKNILVTVTNNAETGKITPASGSNTLFIDKLAKGETKTISIPLLSSPDTDARAYEMKLDFAYEGTKTRPANLSNEGSTASIPVTIMQKIRLKFDAPTVDGESMPGDSTGVYFSMYNMGRSPIFNCMVTIEGDGLSLEETFFQGTVNAGNTMRADLSIKTDVAGEIDGEIVITYEDSLEEQMEERLPVHFSVIDYGAMDDPFMGGEFYGDEFPGEFYEPGGDFGGKPASSFPWLWVGIGAGVVAAAVVLIILLKKRRTRMLEDV